MSKTTTGRRSAAKLTLLQHLRAATAARKAATEARYATWAATNTNPEGIS